MKQIISICAITFISALIFSFPKTPNNTDPINPILGDVSFFEKFHSQPDENTDEDLRIRTHLEYAESLLRKKDASYLPNALKQNRLQLLDLLHVYWTAGIFPRNYDYKAGRRPCFIDKDNRICAVGYLVEKTAGITTAQQINDTHKYDELLAMNTDVLDGWIASSGLTKEECAMIQPTYGPTPVYTYNHISSSYGISSSVLGGLNLSLNAINTTQLIRGEANNNTIPFIGLLTGTTQIILGATNVSKNVTTLYGTRTNESKRTLSMINIGMGTTTIILSAWNLITRRKVKDRLTSWNIYSVPVSKSKMNLGLSFSRKL